MRSIFRISKRHFSNTGTTDFGFKEVPSSEKENLVKGVFNSVARKYDLMNDLMSVGVHRLWKDKFVESIGVSSIARINPNYIPRHLDVAGGTGDIAFRMANELKKWYTASQLNSHITKSDIDRTIVVSDINVQMLEVGRGRVGKAIGDANSNLVSLHFQLIRMGW
jgi:2-methoxy-6-polyprenyl-1,4-benzoquinol methylase